MEKLHQQVESLIFATEDPIRIEEIQEVLEEAFGMRFPSEELHHVIDALRAKYADETYAFELIHINEGYQFLTKGAYHHTVGIYLKQTTRKRLSRSALETLSIVAYKQPVAKSELEKIRGVSCDYALQKLLEKELVSIIGRAETPGRPLLYGTSGKFMDYFGLKSLNDLPTPKEFKLPENTIGAGEAMEEE